MPSNRNSRNFSWIRGSKSTDSDISDDIQEDDYLDSDQSDDDEGNNNAKGLEMESFIPSSPRAAAQRLDSNGSMTLRRSNSSNHNHYGNAMSSSCTQRRVSSRGGDGP